MSIYSDCDKATEDIWIIKGNLYKYSKQIIDNNLKHILTDHKGVNTIIEGKIGKFIKDNVDKTYSSTKLENILELLKLFGDQKQISNKNDLKNGFIVAFRNKNKGTVYKDKIKVDSITSLSSTPKLLIVNTFLPRGLSDYREDMRHKTMMEYDIMRVYCQGIKIYDRRD